MTAYLQKNRKNNSKRLRYKCEYCIHGGKIIYDYNNFFSKRIDYLLDINHKLQIGFYHIHLSQGTEKIICAGFINVNDYGYITYLDNLSGHYRPTPECLVNARKILIEKLQINLDYTTFLIGTTNKKFISCLNHKPKKFESSNKINYKKIQPKLEIQIPENMDWDQFKIKNKLSFLETIEDCEKYFKNYSYYQKTFLY